MLILLYFLFKLIFFAFIMEKQRLFRDSLCRCCCNLGGFMCRPHFFLVLFGSWTRCPWECPAEEMLNQSWQPWCWGHYSVCRVCLRSLCIFLHGVLTNRSSSNTGYLFHSPTSDIGSHTLWSVRPHEDLPCDVCSADRTDAANAWHWIGGGQKRLEDLDWFHQKLA